MAHPPNRSPAPQGKDVKAIEALLDEMTDAWNSGDAKAFVEGFAAEGDFTNAFGVVHHTRDGFAQSTADMLRGFGKDTGAKLLVRNLRFIRPDAAVAEVDVEAMGHTTLPPGFHLTVDRVLRGAIQLVFVREKGEWWIAAFQHVPVAPYLPRGIPQDWMKQRRPATPLKTARRRRRSTFRTSPPSEVPTQSGESRDPDIAAIRAILTAQEDSWNSGDAKGYAARFAADGSFTNVLGMLFYGHEAFERRHTEMLHGFAKGATAKTSVGSLRFIRSDVAIAEVAAETVGYRLLPAGTPVSASGAVKSIHQMVFVREDGEWWITAWHALAIAPSLASPMGL